MAEEIKQEENKTEKKNIMPMLLKVVLGIVFLVLAVYLLIGRGWWQHTWILIMGCAAPFLVLAAIITFAIAKE
jgi:membrane protein YdbS with pleckstrin-like domain